MTDPTKNAPAQVPAVAALRGAPVDDPESFVDISVDQPVPGEHDLLVDVRAVSVNPVDVKVRAGLDAADTPKVLGYDAAGVVVAVGSAVSAYGVGDEVYYAGSIARSGSNTRRHLVDERIVGHKPSSLDFAEAAALPLTTITAWEALFDRLRLTADSTGTLLVVGGAGGVGSMVVQLAAALTGVTVIATAARPESVAWARSFGADHIVDHHHLAEEVLAIAPDGIDRIFTSFSAGNIATFEQILAVHGEVVAIDDPHDLDLLPLKDKSVSWHWEFMFARPLHAPDDTYQRDLLDEAARLIDAGTLRTTLSTRLHPLDAATLREAHRQVESGATVGKVVVSVD